MKVNIEEITNLMEKVNENFISELKIVTGDSEIYIKKQIKGESEDILNEKKETAKKSSESINEVIIKAPLVGTFYAAPSVSSPAFVKEGDLVDENQVLCIIEAMKLMNDIKSEVKGKVKKILVENESLVEYGQPLFIIELL